MGWGCVGGCCMCTTYGTGVGMGWGCVGASCVCTTYGNEVGMNGEGWGCPRDLLEYILLVVLIN